MSDLNDIVLEQSQKKKWLLIATFISLVIFALVLYFALKSYIDSNKTLVTNDKNITTRTQNLYKVNEEKVIEQNISKDRLDILIKKLKEKKLGEKPKKIVDKTTKKIDEEINIKKEINKNSNSNIYIQVGATFKVPSIKFLETIKEKGYNYKLHKIEVNNKTVTKILVGPFQENNIKQELEKIKKDIATGAYIYKIK
ncbi:MAG: Unknown protein [uncultured Campylobacterales bacterium]|uniref:SPOR domain-containing protein n=1 Tax=uncultured Campylobacterales bacterium TaxID=352960 RepID=A0A6S6TCN5_9BACT|nr:MAG: Unknown protein [uncultured Campylobacterales bacterium]